MTDEERFNETLRAAAIAACTQGALKNHLGLECEIHIVDLARGDQLASEYIAMNPNKKKPVREDDG
jgi:hypothetical protein